MRAIAPITIASVLMASAIAITPVASRAQAERTTVAALTKRAKRLRLVAERARIDAELAELDIAAASPQKQPATPTAEKADANPQVASAAASKPATGNGTTASTAGNGPGKFGELGFGIGVSYTGDVGNHDRIGAATLDANRIVRIDDTNNVNARIMLEGHYFFSPKGRSFLGVKNGTKTDPIGNLLDREKRWGVGPFIAIRPGSDDIIDAVGAGIMLGFRRSSGKTESFNFGIGVVVDPNVRILGEGITADMPLPPGETDIRYRETSQLGVLAITSFSF